MMRPATPVLARRKAISEMLAVIILLALAVVAGVLVYQIFMGKAGVASTNTAISVQSAYINGQTGVFAITIQNTGSNTIQSISISVYQQGQNSPAWTYSTSQGISPGQTWSYSTSVSGTFQSGTQYTIVVQASTSSSGTGSSTVTTVTVTAS